MATSDLCAELQKDVRIDATMERRICTAVLKQLDDTSNDVQSIAVKWCAHIPFWLARFHSCLLSAVFSLGFLVKKVQEAQVGDICDKLCSLILEGKAELRCAIQEHLNRMFPLGLL